MPYVTSEFYVEYDFRDLDIETMCTYVSSFRYYLKNEKSKPFFEGLLPPPEEKLKDIEEFDSLASRIRYFSAIPGRITKEDLKRYSELRKVICETIFQWGEQAAQRFSGTKSDVWRYWVESGFPYIDIKDLRRPATAYHLEYELSKKTKGSVTLSFKTRSGPKLLTYNHWEISENGGVTWKLIRKTKNKECRVTKLELGQTYHFRYYMSNPKGRSSYSDVREVRVPGIAGKPAVSLKKYPENGAVGALLDEYRRAVSEMKVLIQSINTTELTRTPDYNVKDENCRSIQTILAHVVSAGHNFMVEIRKKKGEELKYYDKELLESVDKYRLALNGMFNYAVQLFEDYPKLAVEELDDKQKIKVQGGQLYDVEQMMEHAIVHVLRHRRQVERFLGKMNY